ncbi:predicted protein [Naegleria gruberi]|uniref:Predicted protein n=1 Tax=Naegleria gruberi TaxID=5762 RepID=D2VJR8_NAEGR|nr:uncharacterized protein NAEGRDRAFT_69138 [Naegleria gruberi]EFC42999.1 predicted protein [Naegleria gruberi]|eukprot:XP_002675743.1 predicted protein [Naegleria gruberi strain NEG-M]
MANKTKRPQQQDEWEDESTLKKVPVTLLSGFLGAGKTTLLRHILKNRNNLRVAVIVNDMAALNIDEALVEKSGVKLKQSEEKLVSMKNGCICCTLREDLLVELYELAQEGKFDYCVIESTGIGEPMQVAETFTFDVGIQIEQDEKSGKRKKKNKKEKKTFILSDFAQLDTCVTVVDCNSFFQDLKSVETLAERYNKQNDEEYERNLANLLIDQIEFANVILLNKTDLVTPDELTKIKGVISKLNPDATVHETQNSTVPLEKILNTGLFDFEKAACNPGWLKEIRGSHNPETLEYGISSFVYRRRKPFNTKLLFDFFYSEKYMQQNVLRSKGYCWLNTRNDYCGDWEQAGNQITIHDGGLFFAALGEEQGKSMYGEEVFERVKKEDFKDGVGDRRQELVIIGQNLNEEEITKRLDALLISDEDFAKGVEYYSTQLCGDEGLFAPFNSFEQNEEMEWETDEEEEEKVVPEKKKNQKKK